MFEVVYESTNPEPVDYGFVKYLFPLLFGIVMTIIAFIVKKKLLKKLYLSIGLIAIGLTLILGLIVSFLKSDQIDYDELSQIHVKVVEGEVTNFHPMPKEGHDTERFKVDSVFFEYSGFVIGSKYFTRTSCFGGPINRNGQYVRLSYITNSIGENKIVKVELKKGEK